MKKKEHKKLYKDAVNELGISRERHQRIYDELRASRERELALQAEIGLLEATLHRLLQQRNIQQ